MRSRPPRREVLRFLDAGDDYVVCFTANATAAIKLVADAYPFDERTPCVLTADNHNSVNGIRELARRRGAPIEYLPLRDDLRLAHPEARLAQAGGGGLFAFPAQSNFSGVQHPLSLVRMAQSLGYHGPARRGGLRSGAPAQPARAAPPTSSRSPSTRSSAIRPALARWWRGVRRSTRSTGRGFRAGRSTTCRCSSNGTGCARRRTASKTAPPTFSISPRSRPALRSARAWGSPGRPGT